MAHLFGDKRRGCHSEKPVSGVSARGEGVGGFSTPEQQTSQNDNLFSTTALTISQIPFHICESLA